MAQIGAIESELGSLPPNMRGPLINAFRAFLRVLRFGRATNAQASENFAAGFYTATTPAVAGTEFSIAHGFGVGRVPYLLIPVLDVTTALLQAVPLTVTRAADDKRVYLSSSVASAPIVVYLEG